MNINLEMDINVFEICINYWVKNKQWILTYTNITGWFDEIFVSFDRNFFKSSSRDCLHGWHEKNKISRLMEI